MQTDWTRSTGSRIRCFRHARKVRGIVRTAGALPLRDLTEGAERARAIDLAVSPVRRRDLRGRFAGCHPRFNRAHLVEGVGAWSALTVAHARHHIKLYRRSRALRSSGLQHVVEILHRALS